MNTYDYGPLIKDAEKFKVRPVKRLERIFVDLDKSEKICCKSFELCNKKFWIDYEERKQVLFS